MDTHYIIKFCTTKDMITCMKAVLVQLLGPTDDSCCKGSKFDVQDDR